MMQFKLSKLMETDLKQIFDVYATKVVAAEQHMIGNMNLIVFLLSKIINYT